MKRQEYLNLVVPIIRDVIKDYNNLVVVAVAQSAVETAWGESYGFKYRNNLFGIKKGKKRVPKVSYTIQEAHDGGYYMCYKTLEDCVVDYFDIVQVTYPKALLLSNSIYDVVLIICDGRNRNSWTGGQNPNYHNLIWSVIVNNRLYEKIFS